MYFLTKRHAFDYFQRCNDSNLCIIAEDINNTGSKQYYVGDSLTIYNNIISNNESNYYEIWGSNFKINFAIDLDINDIDNITSEKALNIVIETITKIKLSANEYYKHNFNTKDFIVLQSMNNNKRYSYHIICKGLTFNNHLIAKDFFMATNKKYDLEYCDITIYNLTCLRLCFCSKKDKNSILMPIQVSINGKNTCLIENNYKQWLNTWITCINNKDKLITKKIIVKVDKTDKANKTDKVDKEYSNINVNVKDILNQLPQEYCDCYSKWIAIGMILSNISTDDNNYFSLWNEWSKKSNKYNESLMLKKWYSFKHHTNKLGLGSLIKWAQDCGVKNIFPNNKSIESICNKFPIKPIILPTDNAIIINQEKLTDDIFLPHLNQTLLAIQSEKGTGKTTNLFKALFNDIDKCSKDTSILFISSRRTFGIKLLGDLEKYGFKLYSNIKDYYITAKRVICQLDSLCRLDRNKYDIVVVDECESLARYCTSQHFIKNNKASTIVSTLEMRVLDANNVYILDADLSIRCLNFYKNIKGLSNVSLIINEFKAYKDYTVCTLKYCDWLNKVIEYIKEKKKIVIPMASNSKAKDLVTKIKNDFPKLNILLIHKETSDEDKVKNVLNVNITWAEYDVVVYTPSVSMGISFDVPDYFDAIFAYGCNNSLGAQEFCQMIHRVRHPKELSIFLSIDYYRDYNETDDTISYDMVEQMLCSDYYLTHYDLHNNILPKKIIHNEYHNIVTSYPYKHEPIYDLYVRNSLEVIEDKLNFGASLYGYMKYKQYNLTYEALTLKTDIINEMKAIRNERETNEKLVSVDGIFDAIDLTQDEYLQKIKQRNDYLNENDIFAINKYNIKNCYKVNELSKEFICEFYDKQKMKWFKNITTILNTSNQTTNDKLEILKENHCNNKWIYNCYLDFTTKNNFLCHNYVITIINNCGFDINNLGIILKEDKFYNLLDICIADIDTYKQQLCFKFDIRIPTKSLIMFNKRDKIKFINTIINSMYGLHISRLTDNTFSMDNNEVWNNIPRDNKFISNDIKQIKNDTNNFDSSNLDIFI